MTNTGFTVREAVFALLRDFGLTTIFGNPGSTELPMYRDFPADFRYVLGLQESVVVAMADGFAQARGGPAFVNLHSAIGVGHAAGSLFTAFRNQSALVVTAGQQARSILPFEPFLYSAEATNLPRPYVKWGCEPARAEDVPAAIGVALARPGRRVIALLGDGSAMYSIQGLWSAAELALPVTFVIVNNGGYRACARAGCRGRASHVLRGARFGARQGVRGPRPSAPRGVRRVILKSSRGKATWH